MRTSGIPSSALCVESESESDRARTRTRTREMRGFLNMRTTVVALAVLVSIGCRREGDRSPAGFGAGVERARRAFVRAGNLFLGGNQIYSVRVERGGGFTVAGRG